MKVNPFQVGDYRGASYGAAPLSPEVLAELGRVRGWLTAGQEMASLGRHQLIRHPLMVNGTELVLAVKSFASGSWLRDRDFRKNGSKAERSFHAAVRLVDAGVGTPRPFAFVDRWVGNRLVESYYLCTYQDGITSFRDELNRLYREDPLCRRIMTLMETVALAIADQHDAGVCHRDLGNQNILLRRVDEDTWADVQFIDLNRAHLADALSLRERARDLSRIDLPSDFLRVFKCMYFRHQHPPAEFQKWERRYRRRFALHTASRKYRHPIREARRRKQDATNEAWTPRGRELWVWDDRSVQAVSTLQRKERKHYYKAIHHLVVGVAFFRALRPIWRHYEALLATAFTQPVELTGRLGLGLGPLGGGDTDREAGWLQESGVRAVLIRLYRHEPDAVNERAVAEARRHKAAGRRIFIALVQDRAALRDPTCWAAFVQRWVPALHGLADHLEIGHAVNRVKWGLWDMREYRILVEPVLACAGTIPLCGPSVIDFEYHYLPALLAQVPDGAFSALSHHLYVDRRGAPENHQGRFAALEKFALAKAVAAWSPAIKGDRLIVSEVNWPLLDTGEYSPVNSPYIIPNSHTEDPSVDEELYADYMLRYVALALCSGLVDEVYWWRLVARGFGLLDDTDEVWRPRPAFRALQVFIRELGQATFTTKLPTPPGVWALQFERRGASAVVLAWAHPEPVTYTPPREVIGMISRGGTATRPPAQLTLTGTPVYLMLG